MLHGLQDDEMWIRLSLFFSRLPARAFFDGPTNTSNGLRGRTFRSLFPVSAARCDAQLTAAYAAAGSDFSSTLQTRTLEGWPVFGEARDEVLWQKWDSFRARIAPPPRCRCTPPLARGG
jgi:hypothetical protein